MNKKYGVTNAAVETNQTIVKQCVSPTHAKSSKNGTKSSVYSYGQRSEPRAKCLIIN